MFNFQTLRYLYCLLIISQLLQPISTCWGTVVLFKHASNSFTLLTLTLLQVPARRLRIGHCLTKGTCTQRRNEFKKGRTALRITSHLSPLPPHTLRHTAQEHQHTHHTTGLLKHNIHKNVCMKMHEYKNELCTYVHTRHTYIDLHFSHQCMNDCLICRLGGDKWQT